MPMPWLKHLVRFVDRRRGRDSDVRHHLEKPHGLRTYTFEKKEDGRLPKKAIL